MYQTPWPTGDARSTRTLPSAAERQSQLHRNVFLWGVQICLAMFFAGAGYAKLTQPLHILGYLLDWTTVVSPSTVRAAGWFEIVVALGIVAPVISWRLRPVLLVSALAIVVQTTVMSAHHGLEAYAQLAIVHLQLAVVNLILFIMAGAVLAGRLHATATFGLHRQTLLRSRDRRPSTRRLRHGHVRQ